MLFCLAFIFNFLVGGPVKIFTLSALPDSKRINGAPPSDHVRPSSSLKTTRDVWGGIVGDKFL